MKIFFLLNRVEAVVFSKLSVMAIVPVAVEYDLHGEIFKVMWNYVDSEEYNRRYKKL